MSRAKSDPFKYERPGIDMPRRHRLRKIEGVWYVESTSTLENQPEQFRGFIPIAQSKGSGGTDGMLLVDTGNRTHAGATDLYWYEPADPSLRNSLSVALLGNVAPKKELHQQVAVPRPKTSRNVRWFRGHWQQEMKSGWKDIPYEWIDTPKHSIGPTPSPKAAARRSVPTQHGGIDKTEIPPGAVERGFSSRLRNVGGKWMLEFASTDGNSPVLHVTLTPIRRLDDPENRAYDKMPLRSKGGGVYQGETNLEAELGESKAKADSWDVEIPKPEGVRKQLEWHSGRWAYLDPKTSTWMPIHAHVWQYDAAKNEWVEPKALDWQKEWDAFERLEWLRQDQPSATFVLAYAKPKGKPGAERAPKPRKATKAQVEAAKAAEAEQAMTAMILELGATKNTGTWSSYPYRIRTIYGPYLMVPRGPDLMGRFEVPTRALGNPYSGKWNFHDSTVDWVRMQIAGILPKSSAPKPASKPRSAPKSKPKPPEETELPVGIVPLAGADGWESAEPHAGHVLFTTEPESGTLQAVLILGPGTPFDGKPGVKFRWITGPSKDQKEDLYGRAFWRVSDEAPRVAKLRSRAKAGLKPYVVTVHGDLGRGNIWKQVNVITDGSITVFHMTPAVLGGWKLKERTDSSPEDWEGMTADGILDFMLRRPVPVYQATDSERQYALEQLGLAKAKQKPASKPKSAPKSSRRVVQPPRSKAPIPKTERADEVTIVRIGVNYAMDDDLAGLLSTTARWTEAKGEALGGTWDLMSAPLASQDHVAVVNLLLANGVKFEVADETSEWSLWSTREEPNYDGFGTFTVGTLRSSPQERVVAVRKEREDWQANRYGMGSQKLDPDDWIDLQHPKVHQRAAKPASKPKSAQKPTSKPKSKPKSPVRFSGPKVGFEPGFKLAPPSVRKCIGTKTIRRLLEDVVEASEAFPGDEPLVKPTDKQIGSLAAAIAQMTDRRIVRSQAILDAVDTHLGDDRVFENILEVLTDEGIAERSEDMQFLRFKCPGDEGGDVVSETPPTSGDTTEAIEWSLKKTDMDPFLAPKVEAALRAAEVDELGQIHRDDLEKSLSAGLEGVETFFPEDWNPDLRSHLETSKVIVEGVTEKWRCWFYPPADVLRTDAGLALYFATMRARLPAIVAEHPHMRPMLRKLQDGYAMRARDYAIDSGNQDVQNRVDFELGPRLMIQEPKALDRLEMLEGYEWVDQQRADEHALRNILGFFTNRKAFEILRDMGPAAVGLTVNQLDPDAGAIAGGEGRLYALMPDGELMLVGDTATPAFVKDAKEILRVA